MACYSPLRAWKGGIQASGKRSIVFQRRSADLPNSFDVPCGQCVGCRLERSRQWAMRCLHESSLYMRNCFITLTYDDAHLPKDGSVDVREYQLFMKRLRKAYSDDRIRFFHCGEYGEVCGNCGLSVKFCMKKGCRQFVAAIGRPHYHACLFNFDFKDKYLWSRKNGFNWYRSPSLEKLWTNGNSIVGGVSFESAGYVARYVMKKVNNEEEVIDSKGKVHKSKDEHYVDKATGVIRNPEYVTMSRRPGIGRGWFDNFKSDVYPWDFVVVNGKKVRPPKFYDALYEVVDPVEFDRVKAKRVRIGKLVSDDNDSFRLPVKEEVKKSRIKNLIRPLEADYGD